MHNADSSEANFIFFTANKKEKRHKSRPGLTHEILQNTVAVKEN
jgi:hypothetical protein